MRRLNNCLFVSVILIAIPIFSHAQNTYDKEVRKEIQENFQHMGAAMQDGNTAKLASYFTENAFFKLPGQLPVKGREAIQKVHDGMLEQGLGIRPKTEEVQVFDEHAIELGTVDILGPDGKVAQKAYYLTLWKKSDEGWKISRDMVSGLPTDISGNGSK